MDIEKYFLHRKMFAILSLYYQYGIQYPKK